MVVAFTLKLIWLCFIIIWEELIHVSLRWMLPCLWASIWDTCSWEISYVTIFAFQQSKVPHIFYSALFVGKFSHWFLVSWGWNADIFYKKQLYSCFIYFSLSTLAQWTKWQPLPPSGMLKAIFMSCERHNYVHKNLVTENQQVTYHEFTLWIRNSNDKAPVLYKRHYLDS